MITVLCLFAPWIFEQQLERICLDLTDFVPPEDWGPEYPIPGTVRHNVPIPTIYNVDGKSFKHKQMYLNRSIRLNMLKQIKLR